VTCSLPRSLAFALASLTLGALPWAAFPRLRGQVVRPPAAADPAAALPKRVAELDSSIQERLEAGHIAQAIAPAQEKVDLLDRTRGKEHWQTGDARRDLETYRRLAFQPREVQDRFVKAERAQAKAREHYKRGEYAEAARLSQETITDRLDVW
jgi:hypothetical protein